MANNDYLALASLGLNTTDIRVLNIIRKKAGAQGRALLTLKELSKLSDISGRYISTVMKKLRDCGAVEYFYDGAIRKNCITIGEKARVKPVKVKTEAAPKESTYKGPLTPHRLELFEKIQQAYHPDRAYIQIPSAMNAFNHECTSVSIQYKPIKAKRNAIEGMVNKLLDYISHVKTTDVWNREGGKYLPGIGNLIRSGKWKGFVPVVKHKRDTDKETLKSIFRR